MQEETCLLVRRKARKEVVICLNSHSLSNHLKVKQEKPTFSQLILWLLYQLSLQPPSRAILKTDPLSGKKKEWGGIFISMFNVSTSAMCSLSPPGHKLTVQSFLEDRRESLCQGEDH